MARAGPRLDVSLGLSVAVEHCVADGAAVDRAHRQLEQRRLALLYPGLPEFERLRARLDDMRRTWRSWADAWARDFSAGCRAHGFLPEAARQQRTLFDEAVRPMTTEPGLTAYFVVDALRFEMAEELFQALEDTPATNVRLRWRLAELPSVTEVGMNVLAPVASGGKLRPSLSGSRVQGFSCGEFRVASPETRERAMHDRVGGGTCPWLSLEEVLGRDRVALKKTVSQARLLVVHGTEIDDAGEKRVGPAVFDHVLQKLRAAPGGAVPDARRGAAGRGGRRRSGGRRLRAPLPPGRTHRRARAGRAEPPERRRRRRALRAAPAVRDDRAQRRPGRSQPNHRPLFRSERGYISSHRLHNAQEK